MSSTIEDYAYEMALADEYEERMIEDSLKHVSEENVRDYLGTYGDCIESRVRYCLKEGKELLESNHYSSSLIMSSTATELIVRFFILMPLVHGALLDYKWVQILTKAIISSRSANDRKLLPQVLDSWGITISEHRLSNNKGMWETFVELLWPRRNKCIHTGENTVREFAELAQECANSFLELVKLIADKFGHSWPKSGIWNEIRLSEGVGMIRSYTQKDIFSE
ncbi:MAG: hypothetical protein COV45_00025 [Deltaproteobacteria bacterium CG11_big_fil_rev_8_21_14_0_20_47_16]|nr:MAG: hypothetical protein COV45_00025 [Deltaproteobacteria bacterium CG11_big_fil_rev_8_21_14_0_20_47_16]